MSRSAWHRSLIFLFSLLVALWAASAVAAARATEFSGQATVLKGTVTVLGITQNVNVADTGALAPEGGAKQNCVLSYPGGQNCQLEVEPDVTNGAVSATLLSSKTVGQGNKARSRAELADLFVDLDKLLGTQDMFPIITASALSAEANAVCQAGVASTSGDSDILDLEGLPEPIPYNFVEETAEGVLVEISGEKILLPAGLGFVTIYLNEQTVRTYPNGKKEIEVNALRIESNVAGLAATNLIIGYAKADIRCGSSGGACPGDKFTGGAWDEAQPLISGILQGPRRVHVTLGAAHLSSWGHFLYMDKVAGIKFHGQPLNAVLTPGVEPRSGNALVTGTVKHGEVRIGNVDIGFFVIDATDLAEPGRNADQFTVALFETEADYLDGEDPVYEVTSDVAVGSTLPDGIDGGNFQYHGCKK